MVICVLLDRLVPVNRYSRRRRRPASRPRPREESSRVPRPGRVLLAIVRVLRIRTARTITAGRDHADTHTSPSSDRRNNVSRTCGDVLAVSRITPRSLPHVLSPSCRGARDERRTWSRSPSVSLTTPSVPRWLADFQSRGLDIRPRYRECRSLGTAATSGCCSRQRQEDYICDRARIGAYALDTARYKLER